jgi:NADP-dependent 3-hydroxy acid dehydrogenase YdfG
MTQPLTILITGASSGFGDAAARILSAAGHDLVLVARRQDRLDKLAGELKTNVHTVACDVTSRPAVERLFASLPPAFADIDVLINNAGLALGLAPAPATNLDDWELMVDTNIKGLMYFTRLALPRMVERHSGLIINIGSMASHNPYPGGNTYGATKAFVRQFSRNLRIDTLGTGVKVTNLEPGAAETEFSRVRFGDQTKSDEYYAGFDSLTAVDVARAIAWVVEQPAHVNIENIELSSIDQVYGGVAIHRRP